MMRATIDNGPEEAEVPTLGENVRRLRKLRGLSQRELALLAGIAQFTVSTVENSLHEPHDRTIRHIAGALDVRVAELYERVSEADPKEEAPSQPSSSEAARARARGSSARRGSEASGAIRREKVRLGDVASEERIQQASEQINQLFEDRKEERLSAEDYQERLISVLLALTDYASRTAKDAS
jgi:transcriptional regulator with XRE-family HTH domain